MELREQDRALEREVLCSVQDLLTGHCGWAQVPFLTQTWHWEAAWDTQDLAQSTAQPLRLEALPVSILGSQAAANNTHANLIICHQNGC